MVHCTACTQYLYDTWLPCRSRARLHHCGIGEAPVYVRCFYHLQEWLKRPTLTINTNTNALNEPRALEPYLAVIVTSRLHLAVIAA